MVRKIGLVTNTIAPPNTSPPVVRIGTTGGDAQRHELLLQEFFEIRLVGLALQTVTDVFDGLITNPVGEQRTENKPHCAANCSAQTKGNES